MDSWLGGDLVRLSARSPAAFAVEDVVQQAWATLPVTRKPGELLEWAAQFGPVVPVPGDGETITRWEVLATVASRDLVAARVLEPHLDALAILKEAGEESDPRLDTENSTFGVWAAEGAGVRLRADNQDQGWVLNGVKPWCSLAGQVSAGLVSAWVDDEQRGLFAVNTRHAGFTADDAGWVPAGLTEVSTATVTMRGVPAQRVGPPEWYLTRPGFSWGGVGVAAIWYGGAVAVARRLVEQASRREPDAVALLHLGEVDALLIAARTLLSQAAQQVDVGRAVGPAGAQLAAQVRHVVAGTAEEVLARTARALGPGPLSQEPEHANRVADLSLYLRQQHAERDAVTLGRMLLQTQQR